MNFRVLAAEPLTVPDVHQKEHKFLRPRDPAEDGESEKRTSVPMKKEKGKRV